MIDKLTNPIGFFEVAVSLTVSYLAIGGSLIGFCFYLLILIRPNLKRFYLISFMFLLYMVVTFLMICFYQQNKLPGGKMTL